MKFVVLFMALTAIAAQAQSSPGNSSAEIEPQKRAGYTEKDFQYKFNALQTLESNKYGEIQTLFANDVPSLDTLPGDGIAQAVINLDSCAIWNPHTHPRANEILYVAAGTVKMGFQEENEGGTKATGIYGGRLLNFTNVPTGSSVVVPQALAHYIWNSNCEQATIVSSFDNRDPGVSSLAQTLFTLPREIISASTGLEDLNIDFVVDKVKKQSLVSVDKACLKKCKLPIPDTDAIDATETSASSAPQASETDVAASSSGRRMN